jgi:DNA-binding transcriptional regulator YhcF (GntR family)
LEFTQPKGIYQQIADQMRDRILEGEWHEGERIPSVRELAALIGVNPNTVTKSYQALLDREIIENQRGLGYFVAADAKQRIVAKMRDEFVRDELPKIFRTMRVLGLQLADLEPHFAQLSNEQPTRGTVSTPSSL